MTPEDRSARELREEQEAQRQREARARAREESAVQVIREVLGGKVIEEES